MNKIEKSWVDNAAKQKGMLEYQNWFDSCKSLDDCRRKGYIDFTSRIFSNDFYKWIGDPRDKTCLEIGCGGGRLLNAASSFFSKSYGVDILSPESFGKTAQFVVSNNNFAVDIELFHRDDIAKVPDCSVDFVYSFIVFQHFDSWDEADKYLDFIKRVLKPGGVGIIYFGRTRDDNKDVITAKDKNFSDRECSLWVTDCFAEVAIEDKGFDILDVDSGTKQPWSDRESGQFFCKI